MTITSAIVLLSIYWFIILFIVLPINVTTQNDEKHVIKGTAPSSPVNYNLKRRFSITIIRRNVMLSEEVRFLMVWSVASRVTKRIKLNFEDVNKLANLILSKPNIADVEVLVIVRIDSLKELSKLILSIIKIPDKINRLIKKDIKIKNDILIFSFVIFFSELNIFLLTTLFGLIRFIISTETVLRSI